MITLVVKGWRRECSSWADAMERVKVNLFRWHAVNVTFNAIVDGCLE